MGLNREALARLATMLSTSDVERIENNARVAEHVENLWLLKLDELLRSIVGQILDRMANTGELEIPADLETQIGAFFLQHALATTVAAGTTITPAEYVRAAKGKAPKFPASSVEIRKQWDEWRHTGKLPGYTRKQASGIKVVYIRRIQQWWQRGGRDFIHGQPIAQGRDAFGTLWNPAAFDREAARVAIQNEVAVPRARARTIVETETTRYYNTARVNTYDQIETVGGYLYVIVRDAATTKWCRTRAGMVLLKGETTTRKNTPPCHWNCRSELLPLSRLNPLHRKLLEDVSLRPENRTLEPLPKGWNEAA